MKLIQQKEDFKQEIDVTEKRHSEVLTKLKETNRQMLDTMQREMKVAGKAFLIEQKRLASVIESTKHDYIVRNKELEQELCEIRLQSDKVQCEVEARAVQNE